MSMIAVMFKEVLSQNFLIEGIPFIWGNELLFQNEKGQLKQEGNWERTDTKENPQHYVQAMQHVG